LQVGTGGLFLHFSANKAFARAVITAEAAINASKQPAL